MYAEPATSRSLVGRAYEPGPVAWRKTWAIAFLLFCTSMLSAETVWRHLDYRSSAIDSPALWKFWYDQAVSGGPRTIALIGSSRIQCGVSLAEMQLRLPEYRIVQLAKYASGSPIGVLRKLAYDDHFNGIVICDTIEPFLLRSCWDDQRDLFEFGGRKSGGLEAFISAVLLEHLAIKCSRTGMSAALDGLINRGALPPLEHIRMRANRCIEFDFSGVTNLEQFTADMLTTYRARYAISNLPPPESMDQDVLEIDTFVKRIVARGGQVVFLRMPSSGGRLMLEEQIHPRIKYWDRFSAMTSGTCIHTADCVSVRRLICPDESHLDYRQTIPFTDTLVDELARRGVVHLRPR